MDHSQEATSGFIVARGQPAKLLEATKKGFDFVAVPVKISANHALNEAILFTGNHGLGPDGGHVGQHGVHIVGSVST